MRAVTSERSWASGARDSNNSARVSAFDRRLVVACIIAMCLPIVWVSMPPLMDFPNHLTRIWLLAGGADQAPLSEVYKVDWSRASTNIGVDWVAAHLAQVLPFAVVDRLLRLAMLLGPPVGAVILGRVIFGRISVWSLAPFIYVWGTTSIAGFLSYSISLAAALLCAAAMYGRSRLSWRALSLHVVFASLILAIHPFGVLFYIALVSGIIIGPKLSLYRSLDKVKRVAFALCVVGIACSLPVIVLGLFASHAPPVNTMVYGGAWKFLPKNIVFVFLSVILSYKFIIDVLFVVPLILASLYITLKSRWDFHFGLLLIAVGLCIISIFAPNEIGDAAWINRRFPLMAALTLTAAMHPVLSTVRLRTIMIAALLVATLGKASWIGYVWVNRDRDLADVRAVTQVVRPGDRVMLVKDAVPDPGSAPIGLMLADTNDYLRIHLPVLLIKERLALIPTLFAIPGQQPIRVVGLARSEERGMSSSAPSLGALQAGGDLGNLADWRCQFKYVLLLGTGAPRSEATLVPGLKFVQSAGIATLFAVEPSRQGRPCR